MPDFKITSKLHLCAFLWLFVLGFCAIPISSPAAANLKYASIVMDADTGQILHQRYADKMLHPASLTKIMTLLMVFDALDKGTLKLDDRIPISSYAASMVPSKLGLSPGSTIKVEDAIYALVTKSANDIAVAVAERLGKTETRFAVFMTMKAQEIGMSRTRFVNASGLHHPKQVSTARDMAKMARYLIRNYPTHYRYFSTRNFTYNGHSYRNHNRLMSSYDGMDGIKTGYIQASGFNLVASAQRGNKRLIGVVFGGRSSATRNAHMKELLDNAFGNTSYTRIAKAPPVPEEKPVMQLASLSGKASPDVAPQNILETRPSGDEGVTQLALVADQTAKHIKRIEDLIGQGDIDPELMDRFETGLISATLHTGAEYSLGSVNSRQIGFLNKFKTNTGARLAEKDLSLAQKQSKTWSVQIGAYEKRATSNQVLYAAHQKLPESLKHSAPFVAPVKSADGWMYRAWLTGLNHQEALLACSYYKACLVISPASYGGS